MNVNSIEDKQLLEVAEGLVRRGTRNQAWQSLYGAHLIGQLSVSEWRSAFPSYSQEVSLAMQTTEKEAALAKLSASVADLQVVVARVAGGKTTRQAAQAKYKADKATLFGAWNLTEADHEHEGGDTRDDLARDNAAGLIAQLDSESIKLPEDKLVQSLAQRGLTDEHARKIAVLIISDSSGEPDLSFLSGDEARSLALYLTGKVDAGAPGSDSASDTTTSASESDRQALTTLGWLQESR